MGSASWNIMDVFIMNKVIKRITATVAATVTILTTGLSALAVSQSLPCTECGIETKIALSASVRASQIYATTQMMNSNHMVSAAISGDYRHKDGNLRNTGYGNQSNHYMRATATLPSDARYWTEVHSSHSSCGHVGDTFGQMKLSWHNLTQHSMGEIEE